MAEFALEAEPREATGKGPARRLRATGRIPGTCYRHGGTSVSVSVVARALDTLLKTSTAGMNTLIDLRVAGGRITIAKSRRRCQSPVLFQ